MIARGAWAERTVVRLYTCTRTRTRHLRAKCVTVVAVESEKLHTCTLARWATPTLDAYT